MWKRNTTSGFTTTLCTQPHSAYSHCAAANASLVAYSHISRYIRCGCMLHLEKENEMH